jgi:DNA polymerase-3 subunit alpha
MAMLEGFYYKPRIDKELLAAHSEGIICLSGCVSSEFSNAILKARRQRLWKPASSGDGNGFRLVPARLFGDRYFIEIMNNGVEIQRLQLEGAVEVAKRIGLPLVATSDCHYVDREDAEAQDVMLCINTGKFRTDANRMKMENDSSSCVRRKKCTPAFPASEDAVARSQQIADSGRHRLELGKRHFPTFAIPGGKSRRDISANCAKPALKERYAGDEEMLGPAAN